MIATLHFIPYVNRPDLLEKAVQSIESQHGRLVIVDNRDNFSIEPDPRSILKHYFDAIVWKTPTALNHSQMMTWLVFECKRLGHPFFTWMHHDCENIEDSLKKLIDLVKTSTDEGRKWGVILTQDPTKRDGPWNHVDVMAAINVDALLAIGCWDWVRFPDYYSDYDAYGKLVKAGFEVFQSGLNIRHQQGGTTTIRADGNRALVNELTWTARTQLWERRRTELGLQWPPT